MIEVTLGRRRLPSAPRGDGRSGCASTVISPRSR